MVFHRKLNNQKAAILEYAKDNRRNQTPAEKALWPILRNRKCMGFKFKRQYIVLDYIADFYCPEKKLVIEIDGSIHKIQDNSKYDTIRTKQLNDTGITVIRFTNECVLNDIHETIRVIKKILGNTTSRLWVK